MSLNYANRICPNCNNPNCMVWLGDFSKEYKYKCLNCNVYFNDIDFEKEENDEEMKTYCGYTYDDMNRVLDFMCNIENHMDLSDPQESDFDVAIQCITTVMNRMKDNRPIEFEEQEVR